MASATAMQTSITALFSTTTRGHPCRRAPGRRGGPAHARKTRQTICSGTTAAAHLAPSKRSIISGATAAMPRNTGKPSRLTDSSARSMPYRTRSRSSWMRENADNEISLTMVITLSSGMAARDSAVEYTPMAALPSTRPAMATSTFV